MTVAPEEEIWLPIPGYEGLYDASNLGRIRSYYRGCRFVKPVPCRDGYPMVGLTRNGVRHGFGVHRLVCLTFHGNPPFSGAEAAHLDGSRTNARASNLKWCTKRENHAHKVEHGTLIKGEEHPNAKLTAAQVLEIKRRAAAVGPSALGREFGVDETTIRDIRDGKIWRHLADA